MTYRDVTLAPDDIEWDSLDARLKDAAFNDDAFVALVEELGDVGALREFTRFHRLIANQLIAKAIDDPRSGLWGGRTVGLSKRLKARRQTCRAVVRDRLGAGETYRLIVAFEVEFPRAVWGEGRRS